MIKLVVGLISNTLAILAAEYLVAGFSVTDDLAGFAVVYSSSNRQIVFYDIFYNFENKPNLFFSRLCEVS